MRNIVCWALVLAGATQAMATPYVLSYGGRLADKDGNAVAGPVSLELRFYRVASGSSPLAVGGQEIVASFAGVSLTDGVFQIVLSVPDHLSQEAYNTIFADGQDVYVEVKDSSGVTYPRQGLASMPFALRVPVDGTTLRFNSQGKLEAVPPTSFGMSSIDGLSAALSAKAATDQALSGDLGGTLAAPSVTKLQGRAVSTTAPTTSQVLAWSGTAWTPSTVSGGGSGTVTSVTASAPLTVTNGTTTPALSLSQASNSTAGYLSSADWTSFNSKQGPMSAASSVSNGYLTSADWLAFNGKQASLGFNPINKAGDSMSGTLSMGGYAINGLGVPSTATSAATKSYVDNQLGGAAFDQTSLVNDYVVKWDAANSKYILGTDQVGSAGGGVVSFNGLSASSQTLAIGSGGTSPSFSSSSSTHTLNIPLAATGSVTAGLLSNAEFASFNNKVSSVVSGTGINVSTSGTTATVSLANSSVTAGSYSRADITVDALGRVTAAANGAAIANSDISSSAAIATTKLSGAVTAIAGHGLGSLATLSSIGAGQISVGSITNAEISGSAAIADTKLGTISTAGKVANSATTAASANTASAIVARDASGNFSAGTITATLSGSATSATNVTGTVAVANGGTGSAVLGAGSLLVGNGTSAVATIAPGASGYVIASNGSSWSPTAPVWASTGTQATTSATAIGIGTAAPAANLHVNGTTAIFGGGEGATPTSFTLRGAYGTGTNVSGGPLQLQPANGTGSGGSGAIYFQTAAAGSPGATPNTMTPRMVITPNGNVGIGSTAPMGILDVNGKLFVSNTGSVGIGTPMPSGIFDVYTGGTSHPIFVNGGGSVGIGTTTPTAALDVNGSVKIGPAGSIISQMGTCSIASTALTATPTAYTCSGVPGSANIVVSCSPSAGIGNVTVTCRANGTAGQVTCNASGSATAAAYTCLWAQP